MIWRRPRPTVVTPRPLRAGRSHLAALIEALPAVDQHVAHIETWGRHLAGVLTRGGRLLAAGNGGSAAEAQHLTSELVGRYRDERRPFSALALHAESSSFTAIGNDYGADEAFARQVQAHGRTGDVLVTLSTSGRSRNLIAAVEAARQCGVISWALTGPTPNPLADLSFDAIGVDAPATATVQEIHLVLVHMLCAAVELEVGASLPYDAEVH
ncbi:MAG TPA: SIS domain-containing protein [Amycolatopsis sp.]|nr:MAG: SIS domain-containing protein [Chloroflexota bacterium]HKN53100.1 SIS domain-containing protein [Amycolatopsis sp.]